MVKQLQFLDKVRDEKPLIHSITNIVVANFQANGLLALGASPVMADAIEEAAEMAAISTCVVLNIGTLNNRTVEAMIAAGQSANKHKIPVVLDPVGAGATTFRKKTVLDLLQQVKITVIRCNAGELAAIAEVEWSAKGVDAGIGHFNIQQVAEQVATQYHCIVAVTGADDVVTDGHTTFTISGGHQMVTLVTGSGCLLSAVTGAFIAVAGGDYLPATVEALSFYKQIGEKAVKHVQAPGSLATKMLDALYSFTSEDYVDHITVQGGLQ